MKTRFLALALLFTSLVLTGAVRSAGASTHAGETGVDSTLANGKVKRPLFCVCDTETDPSCVCPEDPTLVNGKIRRPVFCNTSTDPDCESEDSPGDPEQDSTSGLSKLNQPVNLLQNPNFETGVLSPWFKYCPQPRPGSWRLKAVAVTRRRAAPWDGYIQPQGQYVELAQNVSLVPGRSYHFVGQPLSTQGKWRRTSTDTPTSLGNVLSASNSARHRFGRVVSVPSRSLLLHCALRGPPLPTSIWQVPPPSANGW